MTGALPSTGLVPSEDLLPLPSKGRIYTTTRRVSIDDASPAGRLEFDGIARILQDAGNDDTDDAGLDALGLAWMARRMIVEVLAQASSRERLTISTWCSGTGKRWAERRTSLVGDAGARIESAAVWVHIDPATGRIAPWGERFAANYLEAANGRSVDTRLHHPKVVPAADASRRTFRFRQTDMDAFGHVNNTAYLAVLEEFAHEDLLTDRLRVEIEWRKPTDASEDLIVVSQTEDDGMSQWITEAASGELRATIAARRLTD